MSITNQPPLQSPATVRVAPSVVIKRKSRLTHFSLASIVAAIAFFGLTVIVSHAIIAWNLAFPYVPPLESNPFDKKQLPYEVVVFPSRSGETTVDSWYIPAVSSSSKAESKQTVILSHGYGANREESWVPMYDLAELLNELNYNVIMFDYGYASKRYNAPATWGTEEKKTSCWRQ